MNAATPALPASYNPWPHAIMAFFAVLLLALVGVVWMAVHQPSELVSTNYYDQEILYQGRMDAVRRTQALGSQVSVVYAGSQVVVSLPREHAAAVGKVHFFRPSDSHMDREFALKLDAAARQSIDVQALGSGRWRIRVEWAAGGETYFREENVVLGR